MLKNYLKTAWRNLLKNKFYSFLNIAGLAIGLAIGILILLWVQDELSFDNFHKRSASIYRLELFSGTGASRQIYTAGPPAIGPMAKQTLPEVLNETSITGLNVFSFYKYHNKIFGDESAVFAEPSFFTMFDFHLVRGNAAKPFADDNSVVITKKTAKKFFGDRDPIGKVIIADNKQNFTVSGVINDFPRNSSMQYDIIMPMSFHIKDVLATLHLNLNTDFSYYSFETYLQLKPGTSLKTLSAKLFQIHIKGMPEGTDAEYLLLPLSKLHLYNADGTDKGIETVRIFIIIAILILVIACINYVNLSTARSMLRLKEISMRKIVGAAKTQLFMQFIVETALLFCFAVFLAFGLIYVLMPAFNQFSGKQLSFNLADYHIWMIIISIITGTLAASSIYPALLLSSFEPLKALKGKISTGIGDVLFRKILVVTQFAFSVMLIIGTMIINNQLKYIRSKDIGYDRDQVFSFKMHDLAKHYDAIKAELLKQPGVLAVTRSNQHLQNIISYTADNDWDGKPANQTIVMHPIAIDKDFIAFFKMKLLRGSSFTGAVNDTSHLILNEAAVKETGLKDPIGKRFRMYTTRGTIIGVVKDFHYTSMKEKIASVVFYYKPEKFGTIYIKTTGSDAPKAISAAEHEFKRYNGQYPFGYSFLDDNFNNTYKGEQREGALFNYFAAVAIFISCLGLLGLAAYTAQVRTREIGVRKVLGAGVSSIVMLLARDFIMLVLIAILIAVPVAWFAMNKWLQAFAYRVNIHWWIFVSAGFMAILIAFITISFQSVKAALLNPVKSLRSE